MLIEEIPDSRYEGLGKSNLTFRQADKLVRKHLAEYPSSDPLVIQVMASIEDYPELYASAFDMFMDYELDE